MSSNIRLFKVGNRYRCDLHITSDVMEKFLAISGDENPIHLDEPYALKHGFRAPIVFGNVMGALVSRLVGMELPTREVIILQQSLEFRKPAYVGERVQLEAEVTDIRDAVQAVRFKLTFNSSSTPGICTGQCLIKCL